MGRNKNVHKPSPIINCETCLIQENKRKESQSSKKKIEPPNKRTEKKGEKPQTNTIAKKILFSSKN